MKLALCLSESAFFFFFFEFVLPGSTRQVHGKLLAFSTDKTTSENSNGIGTDVVEEEVEEGRTQKKAGEGEKTAQQSRREEGEEWRQNAGGEPT